MPLDRLVLMIVIVIAAAGATLWLGTILAATTQMSGAGWIVLVPVTLVAYVVWRVIADRLGNKDDDHYDRIDK